MTSGIYSNHFGGSGYGFPENLDPADVQPLGAQYRGGRMPGVNSQFAQASVETTDRLGSFIAQAEAVIKTLGRAYSIEILDAHSDNTKIFGAMVSAKSARINEQVATKVDELGREGIAISERLYEECQLGGRQGMLPFNVQQFGMFVSGLSGQAIRETEKAEHTFTNVVCDLFTGGAASGAASRSTAAMIQMTTGQVNQTLTLAKSLYRERGGELLQGRVAQELDCSPCKAFFVSVASAVGLVAVVLAVSVAANAGQSR